jgi:hypothetical protein
MPTPGFKVTFQKDVSIGGRTYSKDLSINAGAKIEAEESLDPAKTGTLSTRTSNTAGTLTMTPGHGFLTAGRLDLYWAGGSRRGILIGTVATDSVPFTGGAGDNLPVQGTAITAMVPMEFGFNVVGDDVTALGVRNQGPNSSATVVFTDNADVEIKGYVLPPTVGESWVTSEGVTNPVAGGAVAKVYLSHGDSTRAQIVGAVATYN